MALKRCRQDIKRDAVWQKSTRLVTGFVQSNENVANF